MSRKNKWSFIENKEAREALINGSDLLKKCAKTYYVGYKTVSMKSWNLIDIFVKVSVV